LRPRYRDQRSGAYASYGLPRVLRHRPREIPEAPATPPRSTGAPPLGPGRLYRNADRNRFRGLGVRPIRTRLQITVQGDPQPDAASAAPAMLTSWPGRRVRQHSSRWHRIPEKPRRDQLAPPPPPYSRMVTAGFPTCVTLAIEWSLSLPRPAAAQCSAVASSRAGRGRAAITSAAGLSAGRP
jgi:hypothetical protein